MDNDPPTPAAKNPEGLGPDLGALTKQLEALEAAPANGAHTGEAVTAGVAPAEPTIMGFTIGAIFLGLVLSTIGIGMIRYAKVTSQLSPFIVGVALIGMTFVVKEGWIMLGCAAGLIAAWLLVRRFIRF